MTFKNPLPNLMQPLQQALDRLPSRDRKALLLLSVFVLLLLFGLGLWSTHRAAQNATQAATDARELLVWMRAQAPNIRQGGAAQPLLTELVQQSAAQQGLILTQNGDDQSLQVATKHDSFAVLGSWLSRLAEQGVQIRQLDIRQESDGALQLQATLSPS
ncbi:MAG: type II secretion system protein GspM [Flavobacteriales bacterium]